MLAGLLSPTRSALARRAARALDVLCDDCDDGTRALLAADLWCAAGDPDTAARRLLEAGRSATARGALVTAGRLLEQARRLPVTDGDTRATVAEALVEVLALAARVDEALAAGAEALALLEAVRAAPERPARVHLAMARAADAAGRWPLAEHHLEQARRLGRVVADEGLLAAVDALASHVAMGEFRYDDAERLAAAAAEQGARLGLPEIECEALEVLGRRERLRDLDRAQQVFARTYERAREHGLVFWSMRALHELGAIDMLQWADPARLRQASEPPIGLARCRWPPRWTCSWWACTRCCSKPIGHWRSAPGPSTWRAPSV